MSRRVIRIHPYGQVGNQMFQLMFAEQIRRSVPDVVVTGHELSIWGLKGEPAGEPGAFLVACRGHNVPLAQLVALMRSVPQVDLYLESLCARYVYYRDGLDRFRALFADRMEGRRTTDRELVISIRRADIRDYGDTNYFPLPFHWYERVIEETGLHPVFLGQLYDDPYTTALRARFRGATFVESQPAAVDFATIRRARHVMLSISTFSWLAAWLSTSAETIHMPIAGTFHPEARPESDFLPLGDERFHFYETDLRSWDDFGGDVMALTRDPFRFQPLSHAKVQARFGPSIGTDGTAIAGQTIAPLPGHRSPAIVYRIPPPRMVLGRLRRKLASAVGIRIV